MNLRGIEMAPLERVVRAVWRLLATDETLKAVMPGGIWRYGAYWPKASGIAGRVIVAPLQLSLDPAFSRVWTGTLDVGIIYEFTQATANLHLGESTVGGISILTYMRDKLAAQSVNLYDVPGDSSTRLKCIKGAPIFNAMSLTPQPIDDGENVGFFLLLTAHYRSIESVPPRNA